VAALRFDALDAWFCYGCAAHVIRQGQNRQRFTLLTRFGAFADAPRWIQRTEPHNGRTARLN
jgi:hypothetical protein